MPDQNDSSQPKSDPRHRKRIVLMQKLFEHSFAQQASLAESHNKKSAIYKIIKSLAQIDKEIQKQAPERPLQDINKVDLAILRLIVFESNNKKTPKKVLINEAVELAKNFGTESSPRFVNGVLGKLLIV